MSDQDGTARDAIETGRTALGIELGSTRIKACLIDTSTSQVLAVGSHQWENQYIDALWTYALDDVWTGLQAAYAELARNVQRDHGIGLTAVGSIGVSAMMHGYLPFGADGTLLTPFRTWRNTTTGAAARELTDLLGVNIPLRWSIAHLHQAVLNNEPHVAQLDWFTTLAGYVHWRLTGNRVLGVGDASGMFPIDAATGDYDARMLAAYSALTEGRLDLRAMLPRVLAAGDDAGSLTAEGATLLDPTGKLQPGIPLCPPEGDAGTGMVATNAVAPRTGNVSAGTSVFAMVVLEHALAEVHEEIDLVTTPAGHPVAMVHCNNGASELGAWAGVFGRFAQALGADASQDRVFEVLLTEALAGQGDAGGILAYNTLSGEPVVGVEEGRPLVVRTPGSELTLANLMRAHVYGVFAALSVGMEVLANEGVAVERLFAHGGVFRTAGVAQRFLAAALKAPVAVGDTASEGGAWGMAVLAAFRAASGGGSLTDYLDRHVFASAEVTVAQPLEADVEGYARYLEAYRTGLAVERVAGAVL
ncbi:FGGY-family carbohydrate kinase [Demequina sp. B12]|uniref:xylulokinase n=1 Tax=Demequina sp. B12 TaxID=2992757 RepID=UPI00237B2011|nr:FGGY-family carbohydrate kinase [Demequina sp. B12]MDE0571918.1 FGGY-family carbohydrate kinase [Demequina sp. B12]